jgi:hypothetical protein
MIRHVALFSFTDEATAEQKEELSRALAELPGAIAEIRDYRFGSDAGLDPERNLEYAVVADFDSIEEYKAYAVHPAHQRVITDLLRPIIAQRAAVQYEW